MPETTTPLTNCIFLASPGAEITCICVLPPSASMTDTDPSVWPNASLTPSGCQHNAVGLL